MHKRQTNFFKLINVIRNPVIVRLKSMGHETQFYLFKEIQRTSTNMEIADFIISTKLISEYQ